MLLLQVILAMMLVMVLVLMVVVGMLLHVYLYMMYPSKAHPRELDHLMAVMVLAMSELT